MEIMSIHHGHEVQAGHCVSAFLYGFQFLQSMKYLIRKAALNRLVSNKIVQIELSFPLLYIRGLSRMNDLTQLRWINQNFQPAGLLSQLSHIVTVRDSTIKYIYMVLQSLKSDPPGTFCLIFLQPESLWSGYKIIKQNTPEGSDFQCFSIMYTSMYYP